MWSREGLRIIISTAVALVGLWVLTQSTTMGMGAANGYLHAQGGSMDTATFLAVAGSYMESYRWLGAILLAVGAYRALRAPR